MTAEPLTIEPLGDHDYLVRIPFREDVVTIRMRATPEVVTRVAGRGADETRVIAATMNYLTARQDPDDLPGLLDLDDVIAAYGGYLDEIRQLLTQTATETTPSPITDRSRTSLDTLVEEQLAAARDAGSGRSAHTVYGGHQHSLRQTIIAMTAGTSLADHESPGEATLQVLQGHVRLTSIDADWDATAGDHIIIPPCRHGLEAVEDSAVMLTVVTSVQPQNARR